VALIKVIIETLVDGDCALVTIANVVVVADTLVSSLDINAGCVFVAFVHVEVALINLRHAVLPISVEAFFALALESRISLAVDSSLGEANSIRMAICLAIFAIVGLVAGGFSELLELFEIEKLPFTIAIFFDLVDDSLESMDPFASSCISGVIDPLAANYTGVS